MSRPMVRCESLSITDKQFERMRIFWGKMRTLPTFPPQQLELF